MADVIRTVGSGGNYATLQAWADDIGTNPGGMYAVDDVAICHVLNDIEITGGYGCEMPSAAVAIASARIMPVPGSEHAGLFGTGITISTTLGSDWHLFRMNNLNYDVEVQDLTLHKNQTAGANTGGSLVQSNAWGGAFACTVKRCFVRGNVYGAAAGTPAGLNGVSEAIRCVAFDFRNDTAGLGQGITNTSRIYNCSIYNCVQGTSGTSVNKDGRNTISMDCASADHTGNWAGTSDRNMSSDATAPGTTAYQNETSNLIWTDAANQDFTLLPGTNAIGNGEDLGAAYEANIDITGATVTGAWNLGAYQDEPGPGPSGGGIVPVLRRHGF